MITDTDIKKIKEIFVSKKELENLDLRAATGFAESEKRFTKVDKDIAFLKEEVADIKEHLITMEDNILGAISKLQNENTVTSTYRPKIDNHEKRISKLETIVLPN